MIADRNLHFVDARNNVMLILLESALYCTVYLMSVAFAFQNWMISFGGQVSPQLYDSSKIEMLKS